MASLTADSATLNLMPSVRAGQCELKEAAGEVLIAEQARHRPGIAPALGLRAGAVALTNMKQTASDTEG
jgi:hypothetical protein